MKRYAKLTGNVLLFVLIYGVVIQLVFYLWSTILAPRTSWFGVHPIEGIILNAVVSFSIFYVVFRYLYKRDFLHSVQFRKLAGRRIVLAGFVGLMAGVFTGAFAQIPFIQSDDLNFTLLFSNLNDTPVYLFIGFLLIGNVFKETFFRGILFNELRKELPIVVAIVIQGILYCGLFFLFDPFLSLLGFTGSVIFILLYMWFKSIWAPILAQICCQGSQYIIWHTVELSNTLLLVSVMSIASLSIALGLVGAWKQRATSPDATSGTGRGVQA